MSRNGVTVTSEGVTITSTNPLTVAFFEQHNSDFVLDMVMKNMDCWMECMTAISAKQETWKFLAQLDAMEGSLTFENKSQMGKIMRIVSEIA